MPAYMHFAYRILVLLSALLPGVVPWAGAQSASDLFLFDLGRQPDGSLLVHQPRYLSAFNPGGYTNQPCFTPDGRLLVSMRTRGSDQTDIWSLNLSAATTWRVTDTPTSEYSPRLSPDGSMLSVLRQWPGDPAVQQVVGIPVSGATSVVLTPKLTDVAYYTWLTQEELALYTLTGDAHQLVHLQLSTGVRRILADQIGRCLWPAPEGGVLYVHKVSDRAWYLKHYDPATSRIRMLAQTPAGAEDFCRMPDGTILMGQGSVLFAWPAGGTSTWMRVADLADFGLTHITRLAVNTSGTLLAVVHEQQAE